MGSPKPTKNMKLKTMPFTKQTAKSQTKQNKEAQTTTRANENLNPTDKTRKP